MCAELTGLTASAERKRGIKIYGCRHCAQQKALEEFVEDERRATADVADVEMESVTTTPHAEASGKRKSKAKKAKAKLQDEYARKRMERRDGRGKKMMSFDGLRSHLKKL